MLQYFLHVSEMVSLHFFVDHDKDVRTVDDDMFDDAIAYKHDGKMHSIRPNDRYTFFFSSKLTKNK